MNWLPGSSATAGSACAGAAVTASASAAIEIVPVIVRRPGIRASLLAVGISLDLHVMGVQWSDEVDEILINDLAAGLAYATPASGVVIAPMAPLGIRDRDRGTVTLTSSLGL